MSLSYLQQMGTQSPQGSPYGGVALGHAPQQPNMGLGPNRYIPPTFNYGGSGSTGRPDYTQMDWNQMQASYLPRTTNQGETANTYMQQLQQMLGGFSQQYGGAGRQPQMPNFGSYNPGFGGPTSYYDQQRGEEGGMAYAGGSPNFDETGGRGGYGGGGRRGGMGQMPQFNPYMLMQNGLRGMDFNQMFDPRFAALFGGNRFGSRTPNSQQNVKPQDYGGFDGGKQSSGGKPGGI